jgi:hypothetical protein
VGLRPGTALRRALFAATVLHGVDLLPCDDGIELPGVPHLVVGWDALASALGPIEPTDERAPWRLATWLRQVRELAGSPEWLLAAQTQVVGLPVGHALHPGPGWALESVPGGALDLGLGVLGLNRSEPDTVVLVAPSVWEAADLDPKGAGWWDLATERLEEVGGLAIERWRRRPERVLTPLGRVDAVSLLGSVRFRSALADASAGLCAVAMPMRSRGWLNLSAIDPVFAPAAALATDPEQRGFDRMIFVTRHEVALAPEGATAPRRD